MLHCSVFKLSTAFIWIKIVASALDEKNVSLPVLIDTETTVVEIKNTNLPVASTWLCEKQQNIIKIDVFRAQLAQIDANTFDLCRNLRFVYLSENKLTKVDPTLFAKNTQLEEINLSGNALTAIPVELFANQLRLRVLSLSANKLTYFNEQTVRNLGELRELWLYSNELLDIDEEELVRHLPKLEVAALTDNDFSCPRLKQIIQFFQKKLIGFRCRVARQLRKRDYDYR